MSDSLVFKMFIERAFHLTIPVKRPVLENADYQDELFKCTESKWMLNEKHHLKQRYVKFNVDNICRQAASLFGNDTKCVRITKLEGNFNKAYALTMDDDNEVIAKVPSPISGPPSLRVASEVATTNFLRSRTSIRVPEVFAWNSDPENPVDTEYIIMEKIPGIALSTKWAEMQLADRYKIIKQIVEMEKELVRFKFPAYGSLFMRDSVPYGYRHCPLPPDLDPAGLFCIGPSCSGSVWGEDLIHLPQPVANTGPWFSLEEFVLSIPQRELNQLDFDANWKAEVQKQLNQFDEKQSVDEYSSLLHKAKKMLPILAQDPRVIEAADSVLWHQDMHLGQIFVSPGDQTTIQGIIDWQSTRVAPLFIQGQFPEFLRYPKSNKQGFDTPKLPENYDEMDSEEKQEAKSEYRAKSQSKYYEMYCLSHNKTAYNGMSLDRRLWEPFTPYTLHHGSIAPVRSFLGRLAQDWDDLGLAGLCPFSFTEEELKKHNEEAEEYKVISELWDMVKTALYTNGDGWVPKDRWEATTELNKELYDKFMECVDQEPDEAAKMYDKYPFPPQNYC